MRKVIPFLAVALALSACGRGNGIVQFGRIDDPYDSVYCDSYKVNGVVFHSCNTVHHPAQPYVMVKGPDGGFSKETLDWIDYGNCTEEPERSYPECADEE